MSDVAKTPGPAAPSGAETTSTPPTPEDVVLVRGRTDDGQGLQVLRARESRLELGTVHPLEAGKPIHGEVVSLKQRPDAPENVYDVKVELEAPQPAGATRSGPAQVATSEYRDNWDAIYKRKKRRASNRSN